jgi:23S rRNA (guanosine2251-2'-O)-methyltransferase
MAAAESGGRRRGAPKGLAKKPVSPGKDGRRAPSGSGGYGRKRLEGRGPTPKAEERTGHPAKRRAARGDGTAPRTDARPVRSDPTRGPARPDPRKDARSGRPDAPRTARAEPSRAARTDRPGRTERPVRPDRPDARPPARRPTPRVAAGQTDQEQVAGRNAVLEALRAGVPATSLHVSPGLDRDVRLTEAVSLAGDRHIPVIESTKPELDRMTDRAVHQGLVLVVPPYEYAHPADVLARALDAGQVPLLVALDGITDPRNLGAIVRSAAAFGAHGLIVPARRSAGMTASAWKSSAGAAARLPVAQATNLTRTLNELSEQGLTVVGLDGRGAIDLDDLDVATEPLVLVVGAEGKGLSRLVGEACDLRLSIPIASAVESLNAGVATAIALAEVARRRRR